MTEWKEYKLGELGNTVTGKTPSSKFPEEFGNDMPFVTPTDYKNYRKFAKSSERNLSKLGFDKLKNKILPPQSILVTCIGSDMGKVVMNLIPVVTNQQINSIIPKKSIVYPDFLYYKLIQSYETLKMYGQDGTAVPILNKGDFDKIEIQIPPLPEQQAIASVLSSLDNKIDLLHLQNQTLEAMAETLFRQWFIEEAEESWEETKLNEFMDIKHGYAFKGTFITPEETDKILVTPGNFRVGGGFSFHKFKYYSDNEFPESYILNEGDFIVTMTDLSVSNDSLGYPAFVPHIDGKLLLHNQRVGKVILKQGHNNKKMFLYYLMKTSNYRHYILGSCTGTNVSHTSPTIICDYEFTMPDNEKIRSFDIQVSSLYKKEQQNINQIQTLTQLRDTLLPKLMSGEVRVGEK